VALLSLGLLTSKWIDDPHTGHFARLIAYPGGLLLAGLVIQCRSELAGARIFSIAVLAAAVGVMQSGMATSILLAPVFMTMVVCLWRTEAEVLQPSLVACGVALLLPAVASGLFARMTGLDFYGAPKPPRWWLVIPRVWDLESHGWISGLGLYLLNIFTVLAVALWAAALFVAIRRRIVLAIALLIGPVAALGTFYSMHDRPAGSELTGWIYPAALCAIAALAAQCPPGRWRKGVFALFFLSIALRVPRTLGAVHRYVQQPDPAGVFTQAEMDMIQKKVGSRPILLDVADPNAAIFLLVESGRRNMNVQWSQAGWEVAVGYRHWSWKPGEIAPNFVLRAARDPRPGHQFDLSQTM
jgi:hypothetical protein